MIRKGCGAGRGHENDYCMSNNIYGPRDGDRCI